MRPGDHWVRAAGPDETASVTVLLRPPVGLGEQLLSGQYRSESREAAEQNTAADPKDLAAVRAFARVHGLTVQSEDPASRRIVLAGTVKQMEQAFEVEIGDGKDASGHNFRTYRGALQLPESLQLAVTAVLGLDQRPVARHVGR
jgi:hypothetical protein